MKKNKYIVAIEEIVTQDFEVEARNIEEAEDIARSNYVEGVFVLEPGILERTQFKLYCEKTNEDTEWQEI